MTRELSLIVPCFDEATHLRRNMERLLETLDGSRLDYEVVFVDDADGDGTSRIIDEVVAGSDRCRRVSLELSRGRGAAIKTGFDATSGRVTGVFGIGLEINPLYIPRLVSLIESEGYDVATGRRCYGGSQIRTLFRNVVGQGHRWLTRLAIGLDAEDSETDCKFFKRETTRDVVLGTKNDGWFWDTEVMVRASLANLEIIEFPVARSLKQPEIHSMLQALRDSGRYVADLLRFRTRAGFSLKRLSPIYWTGIGYDLAMRLLYGRRWAVTYRDIADRIPDGASVVDVCAGTSRIYRDFLRHRNIDYLALDFNPRLVLAARQSGVKAQRFDIRNDDVPTADYVVMCSSLYHFRNTEDEVVSKLLAAARKAVIISETVDTLSNHGPSRFRDVLRTLTNPGYDADYRFRHDPESFNVLAARYGAVAELEPDSRNAIAELTPSDS